MWYYNFNYDKKHKPIYYAELNIILTYQKSDKSYVVQAADLIAGTVRKAVLQNDFKQLQKVLAFINYKIFLP